MLKGEFDRSDRDEFFQEVSRADEKTGTNGARFVFPIMQYTKPDPLPHNPLVRAFAQRLAQAGKAKMAIVGAAMRKLVHIIFGVLKSGRPFDPTMHVACA
jgi:hypothetical protein